MRDADRSIETHLYRVTAGLGVAVWLLPWLLLDGREAWDHPSYFKFSIPIMSAMAAYAGFRAMTRPWRWPLTLVLAQFVAALLLGGLGNLFPLGIVAFAMISMPMWLSAWLGARFAQRRAARET